MSKEGSDDADNIGVSNPYTLAEVRMKKKINWKKVTNPEELLEKVFDMPYEKLFDPKNDSPLYHGLKIDPETKKPKRIESDSDRDTDPAILESASSGWPDPGDFYEEATEMNDPIQGGIGNCYFIAPLSSVAWTRPYIIAQKTRPTDTAQSRFVDMIEFYNNLEREWQKVEVSEAIPMLSNDIYYFAHSTEPGEIWPAIYEKAFARWRPVTDTPPRPMGSDRPNIPSLAGGNAMHALEQLTGLTPQRFSNSALTESNIWITIVKNCENRRTFNPMVAWTYATGQNMNLSYANTRIAANHCYSILGWHRVNNINYVVLRNPWGHTEPSISTDGGIWDAWEQPYRSGPSWYHPIDLGQSDGIFALAVAAFKTYFAGFGFVS